MSFHSRICLLLFLVLTYTLPSVASASLYENKVVSRVDIVLVKPQPGESFDDQAVLARLSTKPGSLYSENAFDKDLKLLTEEFHRVDPELQLVEDKLEITLKVWPKPLIRTITLTGNENVKTSRLQKELGIKTNNEFDRQGFSEAFRKLQVYYVKHGYFEAKLRYEITPDDLTNEVDIEIIIEEGRSGRIKGIEFTGFSDKEEKDLAGMILTKKYSFFTSWLQGTGVYRDEMADGDRMIVLHYLQNQGYADAKVDVRIQETNQNNRIIIEFIAEKGALYTAGRMTFSGHTLFTNEQINAVFALRPGEAYSPEKVRETARNISDLYGRQGYIDTVVLFEPRLVPGDTVYTVHFSIEEGQQYRVGLIKIIGNTWTKPKVILHETLVVPGEIFNIEKLKKTEQRLQNIGYFENVNVYAIKSDEASLLGDNYRDVHIEVEEKSTGSFGFAFGFSTTEKLYGSISLTERNFNICGIPNIFEDGYQALRGGGEFAHMRVNVGQKATSYYASWTKPYFMDSNWVVGVDFEKASNRSRADDYDINSIGFGLHATYRINAFVSFGTHYRYRDTDIKVPASASQLLKDEAKNSGLISAIGVSLSYDSRNHPMEPSDGFWSRLETEYAGLGGKHHFFTVQYLNSYYMPLLEKGVLKFQGDARFLFPVGDSTPTSVPIDERYFLGGETTVRGYRPSSIGPRYSDGNPRGGISSILFSTEYLYRVHPKVGVFVFSDAGAVTLNELSFGGFCSSVGYGVRLRPIDAMPPIVLGMGYPIDPNRKSDVKRFFLSLGGRF